MPKEYKLNEMSGQKALVLGGLGFIGSNLCHKLVGLGAEVTAFDAMLPELGSNPANVAEIREKIKIVKKDMLDSKALEEAVKEQDFVFNCAGKSAHADSMTKPLEDLQANIVANINLLEACRKFNDNARIVFAGTRAELGNAKELPVTEDTTPRPMDIYSVNKWAASQYHILYHRCHGLKTCSIRISNCYGPRSQMMHPKFGVMNWFIRLALEDKEIKVFGSGEQIRDYNYVDDAVDSMILAAQNETAFGKIYGIGSGEKTKFIDYIKKIVEIAGSGSYKLEPWPEEKKKIDVGDFYADFSLIKKELGWYPKTGLDKGLTKTIDFYRERLSQYI